MSLAKRPKFYELQVPIGRANTIAKRVPQQSRQRLPALILGCYWNSNASPRSRSAISNGRWSPHRERDFLQHPQSDGNVVYSDDDVADLRQEP